MRSSNGSESNPNTDAVRGAVADTDSLADADSISDAVRCAVADSLSGADTHRGSDADADAHSHCGADSHANSDAYAGIRRRLHHDGPVLHGLDLSFAFENAAGRMWFLRQPYDVLLLPVWESRVMLRFRSSLRRARGLRMQLRAAER